MKLLLWVEMEVASLLLTSMLKSCKTLPMLTESILLIRIGIRCQKIESLSYNEANEMANFEQIFCMRKQLFHYWKKHSASNFEHVQSRK
jgi:hypothetical protein